MNATHKILFKACRHLHDELGHSVVLAKLQSPALTSEDYLLALTCLHQATSCVENSLANYEQSQAAFVGSPCKKKAHLLAADISSLGAALYSPDGAENIPINSRAAYLGARYVMEGAALGSAQQAKFLEAFHPGLLSTASQYFRFQQKHSAYWPVFLDELVALDNNPLMQEEAVTSAIGCFQTFIQLMQVERCAR